MGPRKNVQIIEDSDKMRVMLLLYAWDQAEMLQIIEVLENQSLDNQCLGN